MSSIVIDPADGIGAAQATPGRVRTLAIVLGVTAVLAVPAGLLWPESSGSGGTYRYGDIAANRELWWWLLSFLSVNLVLNVPAQAMATLLIVRRRGARWATAGAAVMWLGSGLQAAGVAGLATTYYFAADPGLDRATRSALFASINDHPARVYALMIPGAVLILLGTVLQSIGLFRSHAVPAWVPILSLMVVATFVVPGNGWLGVLTSAPMAAAAIGLGYYAWRRTASGSATT